MGTGTLPTERRRPALVTSLLLAFGGLLMGVGWLWGVDRLWRASEWTTREKVIGTVVLPGGIVCPLAVNFAVPPAGVAGALVVVALLVASLATPAWLVSRAG